MIRLIPCKLLVALACSLITVAAWAQKMEAPPTMAVGDKWTYRFHDKGNKRDPYIYTNEVKTVDATSAWLYGETQEPNARTPKFVWRYDARRAAFVERFDFDATAANGAGARTRNTQSDDDLLQFPLEVGKKYPAKFAFPNREGYTEYKAEVEAFEKIKVEAGEFDAFRIKYAGWWTRTANGSGTGRAEFTVWYAPTVKAIVKREFMDRNQGGQLWNNQTTELVKWEPTGTPK